MIPDQRFLKQDKAFWAHVRSVSQHLGYTDRATKSIKVPKINDICLALGELGLKSDHVFTGGVATKYGELLHAYFVHRADLINNTIQHNLMDAPEAKALYESELAKGPRPAFPVPMNKQKGDKKAPAYLTAMVNMLVERNAAGAPCDFDPRELTSVTKDRLPVRTLARRVDGAFPAAINPVAIWEIKEYYYTTTFGSRVADGVYESLLDGLELEDLREEENIDIKHYLFIDSHYTWWECGRSYLCRIVDMLHMGYVDEVIVGKEIVERLPILVPTWVDLVKKSKQGEELKKTGLL
jgi:hypothetical protein